MNTTTNKKQDKKFAIRMAIYTAIWIVFAIALYHMIKN